jgi:hypothetical protein
MILQIIRIPDYGSLGDEKLQKFNIRMDDKVIIYSLNLMLERVKCVWFASNRAYDVKSMHTTSN